MKKETLDLGNAIQDDIDTINTLLAFFPEGEVTVEHETLIRLLNQIGNVDIISNTVQTELDTVYTDFFTGIKNSLTASKAALAAELEELQDAPDDPAEG